jgi:hypothetical protein
MANFKKLIKESAKEKLEEAVGGVVSTGAVNSGYGIRGGSGQVSGELSGDSRIDTKGEFTFRADELPDTGQGAQTSDFSERGNAKKAFSSEGQQPDSVVLHEDGSGSVTLRDHGGGTYDVVIREGSEEKTFELDREAAQKVRDFFA